MPRRKRSISGRTMIFGFVSGLTIFVWGLEGVWAGHMISTTTDDTYTHQRPVIRYNHKRSYEVVAASLSKCRQLCDTDRANCHDLDKRARGPNTCAARHSRCIAACQSRGW